MKLKKILQLKDFFSIFLFFELTIVLISNDTFKIEYLGFYLLPIGISSLVWNKWLYDGLMDDKDALYSKSRMSYVTFLLIGLVLVFVSVIAFAMAIWKWW